MKRVLGMLLIASPFIAVALVPLYSDIPWWAIGLAFGITAAVITIVFIGANLLSS